MRTSSSCSSSCLRPTSKDTGFLTYDYDESGKDDDQWLYLPALKKTKRIASSDRSGSFMGSDFSYADLTSRDLDQYDYTLMKETDVGGVKVWQIESIPRTKKEIKETGYTKSILFVRQDNYVVIRSVGWLKRGGRLKYMEIKALEQIDGIWIGTEIHMTTKKGEQDPPQDRPPQQQHPLSPGARRGLLHGPAAGEGPLGA